MRKNRVVEQNRCYHLISRLAHRAFFLDDEEKDRAVALMRRVEEFSGVFVLAYAFMSNHFHIFIYVPSAEEIGEGERFCASYAFSTVTRRSRRSSRRGTGSRPRSRSFSNARVRRRSMFRVSRPTSPRSSAGCGTRRRPCGRLR
ncbi:MAG: transposase [Kiritimatiellae bacterium]|nr:transposase [Kiritimatiellia bacterium]